MVFKEKGRFFVLPLGAGAETRLTYMYGAKKVHLRNRPCLPRENRLRAKTWIAILKQDTNHPKYGPDGSGHAVLGLSVCCGSTPSLEAV